MEIKQLELHVVGKLTVDRQPWKRAVLERRHIRTGHGQILQGALYQSPLLIPVALYQSPHLLLPHHLPLLCHRQQG